MFQGKGMFWGHLGQHPFFVLLVVDQFSGQLVKKQEAGSGKVELIWEGGSRIGGGEMFWELGVEMFCVLPSGVSIFAGSGSCDCSGFSSVSLDFDERSQALCSFISRS